MYEEWVQPDRLQLQFNVAQLLQETTGSTREYKIEAHLPSKLDDDVSLVSPVVGDVELIRTGPNILLRGKLKGTLEKQCGRCLTPFKTDVEIEIEEEFFPLVDILTGQQLPEPDDVDEANLIDENILDTSDVVRQELLLASDGVLYCKDDCKGLCPYCGKDRATEPCDCEENQIDARWAGLLSLEIDD